MNIGNLACFWRPCSGRRVTLRDETETAVSRSSASAAECLQAVLQARS